MTSSPRGLLFATLLAASTVAGCGPQQEAPVTPLMITEATTCALDGMLLSNFPGPKAQIHYAGTEPDFFCDTVEMFSIYLNPEQARAVTGIFVQDMGAADWNNPRGHWIDARTAVYVIGSDMKGSMGPTIASFAHEADANRFAGEHGGKVLPFEQIRPDMVVLDGGVLRDSKM